MSGIRPINGMGEAKPVRECEGCDVEVRGRPTHLVDLSGSGDFGFVCDDCYKAFRR